MKENCYTGIKIATLVLLAMCATVLLLGALLPQAVNAADPPDDFDRFERQIIEQFASDIGASWRTL